MFISKWLCQLALLTLGIILSNYHVCQAQDSSGILSFINSFTSTSTSPDCPGECHHALSALFCKNVLESVDCGGPQLRCCIPVPDEPDSELEPPTLTPLLTPLTTFSTLSIHSSTLKPIAVAKPFSIATNLTVHDEPLPPPEHDELEPLPEAEAHHVNVCPGMCVNPLIATFCGHIVNDVHCNGSDRCCTTNVPSSTFPTTMTMTTMQHTFPATRRVMIIRATTASTTKKPTTPILSTLPTTTVPVLTEGYNNDKIPCEGSCISGFLSMLCDGVDPHGSCPGSQRCCVVRRLTTTAEPTITNCPGYCMPALLSGMCNKPARLVPETLDCSGSTICCDNSGKSDTTTPVVDIPSRPFEFPLFPMLLNAAQSVMQSSAPSFPLSQSPQPQSQPPQGFMGSPHTQNYPSVAADRLHFESPPCPVSCVPSFMALTCFGSSVLLELAACPKENMVCCAPKNVLHSSPPNSENPGLPYLSYANDSVQHPLPPPLPPMILPTTTQEMPGLNFLPTTPLSTCGVKNLNRLETPRIMGGHDTAPGEWCWQVALINSQNQYLCGGALIGYQWVLTTAHCITNLIKAGETIFVRVGDYDLTNKFGSPDAQTQRVVTTYVHHNHNPQTLDNNIALLKLAGQIVMQNGACLVCLPVGGGDVRPGERCTVTGYGYMGENGPIPLRIRAVDLPVVAEQECVAQINTVTEKLFVLPASSFCAGGEEGNDACQGDGGGPMVCEEEGFYELTGLVSWGFGCGRRGVPGVYVKVSSFVGWINQIISVNNS